MEQNGLTNFEEDLTLELKSFGEQILEHTLTKKQIEDPILDLTVKELDGLVKEINPDFSVIVSISNRNRFYIEAYDDYILKSVSATEVRSWCEKRRKEKLQENLKIEGIHKAKKIQSKIRESDPGFNIYFSGVEDRFDVYHSPTQDIWQEMTEEEIYDGFYIEKLVKAKSSDSPTNHEKFVKDLDEVLSQFKDLLTEKNRKYGDSALNPVRVFSKADAAEQIKVRIDDKLSRLTSSQIDEDEDVIDDLIGYLILLIISQKRSKATR